MFSTEILSYFPLKASIPIVDKTATDKSEDVYNNSYRLQWIWILDTLSSIFRSMSSQE